MEQFRQIGEVLGSIKALMVFQNEIRVNQRQCSLLFDMFNMAFDIMSEEIRQNLKLEEKNTKWKALEHPLRDLHRVFKEGELYIKHCLEPKDWWVKAFSLHGNRDCVEFHIHNLMCYFSIVIEAIETVGENSGLNLEEMEKKRVMIASKYDKTWNDPDLFQRKFGKQYLVSHETCHRLHNAWREDQWLMLETINEKKNLPFSTLSKQEHRLADLLTKKISRLESLLPASVLMGARDYQVKRRVSGGSQYKEIQWMGESFALRHFFWEDASLNSEIYALLYLSHPNIIRYLCGFHDKEKSEYFLVMELMNKDLGTYMKEVCGPKRRVPFSLPAAIDIMLQIARGMEYLHSQKIYHGDLNPSNVLIKARNSSLEGYFHVKITGFGLTSVKNIPSRGSCPIQNEQTPFIWHAPEVLAEQDQVGAGCESKYSEKADVYSYGMLCFELLSGKVPFEDSHLQGDKMSRNIRAGERPLFPFALPRYLAALTKRCWQADPSQRPNFSSICRILRYVKRLIVVNPHLAQPEIQTPQPDFCDIESGFTKKFPTEGGSDADLNPVLQIPFQLFAYRLAEMEKLNGNKEKNLDPDGEPLFLACTDEDINADGSFWLNGDTRSLCSDVPEKTTFLKKDNAIIHDNHSMTNHDTRSVNLEIPEKKRFSRRTSQLWKSNSTADDPSISKQDTRSVCSEIPERRNLPLTKTSTLPPYLARDKISMSRGSRQSPRHKSFT